jgi:oligopeptide/dipeptide ABC transporter ATP-binding protein
MAQNVIVMYTGRIVEEATVQELFQTPLHPYAQGLMRSIPSRLDGGARKRLQAIPGIVPSLLALPAGCKFNTRCPHAFEKCCRDPEPDLLLPRGGHPVRCWLYEKESVLA